MREYQTDSKLNISMGRVNDENKKAKFKAVFSPVPVTDGMVLCGNVRAVFKDGIAKLNSNFEVKVCVPSYAQISSALALYRAISFFETGTNPETQDFYKCNWSVCLKHKSGELLMLGEWKGGFQIFTNGDLEGFSKEFKKDCEEFLTYFVSEEFSTGYDGTIAGTVA